MYKKVFFGLTVVIMFALMFAGCTPIDGDLDEVREKAWEDNHGGEGLNTPLIIIGDQKSIVRTGTAGITTYDIVTGNIADGAAGSIAWFTDTAGTNPGGAPVQCDISLSAVADNKATVTIEAQSTAQAGTYYFRVTIGTVTSGVLTFKISEALVKSVEVREQSAVMKAKTINSVTYPVLTDNIDDGEYTVSVANASSIGVSVGNLSKVTINNNSGLLTLTGGLATPAGNHNTLTLTISSTTSPAFTLIVKEVTVESQTGTINNLAAGNASFTVTTGNIANGQSGTIQWYSDPDGINVSAPPSGITTATATVTNVASNKATVNISTTGTAAGSYYFSVTIDGIQSGVATLSIGFAALTGTVTISKASPVIGDSLTATYSPGNSTGTATWQWLRNDTPISGATSATYIVTTDDLGQQLRARVIYSGQSGNVISNPTNAVTYPALSGTVSISKTTGIIVGDSLTASFTGNNSGTPTWQWLKGAAETVVSTSQTYTVVNADYNNTLKVRVSYSERTGTVTSSSTSAVAYPTLTGTVSINKTTGIIVGDTLTASISGHNGTGTPTWQWLRNDVAISSTNSTTYTVVAADYNNTLKARVTYQYNAGNVTSNPTGAVEYPALTGTVTITGDNCERGTLGVNISQLGGSGGTISYRWLRGGSMELGTSSTYKVVYADRGQTITVEVSRSGYAGNRTASTLISSTVMGITTLSEFQAIAGTEHEYRLCNNITITGTTWTPLQFNGTLDGNGKTIDMGTKYVSVSSQPSFHYGLFNTIVGQINYHGNPPNYYDFTPAVIKNLKLTGTIEVNNYTVVNNYEVEARIGALVADNLGIIQNVTSSVSIKGTVPEMYRDKIFFVAGGLVGRNQGTISDCYTRGGSIDLDINLYEYYTTVGGIAGSLLQEDGSVTNATITRCWSDMEVRGYQIVGGIAGSNNKGSISNCVALQEVIYMLRYGYMALDQHAFRIVGDCTTPISTYLSKNYGRNPMIKRLRTTDYTDTTGAETSKQGAGVLIDQAEGSSDGSWWQNTTYASWISKWGGTSETLPWKWNATLKRPVLWFES